MTDSNLDLVRRAMGATRARPKRDFATINALYHPDHELASVISGLDGRTFRGARGFQDFLAEITETWESYDWTLDELSEIDEGRVLVVSTATARTRRAGVAMRASYAVVITLREGKLVRTEVHSSREEALKATRAGQ